MLLSTDRKVSKHQAYRQRKGDDYRAKNSARMRAHRAVSVPRFVGVDSEGIGRGKNHRAVLLGVGESQYTANDIRAGLHWREVFEFLYEQFQRDQDVVYVGFYLGYDFNQWLRTLPMAAARSLFSPAGIASRKQTRGRRGRRTHFPVRCDGWEFDMLGMRRLSIRPQVCTCKEDAIKCSHTQAKWMHVCDAGPFFQTSFINVLDPKNWEKDPGGPICDEVTFNRIREWKDKRSTFSKVTPGMMQYNREENLLLAECMNRLARGFRAVDIHLSRDQWYGPGASASKWLDMTGAIKQVQLADLMPGWFTEACMKSYFGGWFEIFSHGIIQGSSWNYDINNAYPFACTKLPHICEDCRYTQGTGDYRGSGAFVLLHATVYDRSDRIGPVPYRDKDGSILRPSVAKGWYWKSELDASARAGLIKRAAVDEWMEFIPCQHPAPFTDIRRLYDLRLSVGKSSAQGMAIKLNNNSVYGKFAQTKGSAPFNNWLYASFITSHCRTQILDAIASHPTGASGVLMVATDGVCFSDRHVLLPVSKALGEWEESEYTDLCLFKPGVYWHKDGKEKMLQIKSRGVPKKDFGDGIELMEQQFRMMLGDGHFPGKTFDRYAISLGENTVDFHTEQGWPYFYVKVPFRMKSCKQALNEGKWDSAGEVLEEVSVRQDSDPHSKRRRPRYNAEKNRIDTIVHDGIFGHLETYYYGDIKHPANPDMGYTFDGHPTDPIREIMATLRDKQLSDDEGWVNIH